MIDYRCYSDKGYKCDLFEFDGKEAIVVCPKKRDNLNRWALKTEYFNAFPYLEYMLLENGFHIAFVTNDNRWADRKNLARHNAFAEFVNQKYGLNKKCVPIGMSCGGLYGIKFSSLYPKKVACLYIDAPVVNLLSLAGYGALVPEYDFRTEIMRELALNESTILSYRDHALDHLPNLIKNNIPTVLVYGDADDVVYPKENANLVEQAFKGTAVPFLSIVKPGCNHHPHSLVDSTPTAEFILKYYNK